jgi:hypothetical protein
MSPGRMSRQDPWAPAVLEPLIIGLKQRGFCFSTLRDHPDFSARLAAVPRPGAPASSTGSGGRP